MFIKHSNKSVSENEMAVTVMSVGKLKAGTLVMVTKIKGEVAEVEQAFAQHSHFVPLAWLVWVPSN